MKTINKFGLSSNPETKSTGSFIRIVKELDTKVSKDGDKMTGNLDMNNNRLINIGNPIDDRDCVTREYFNTVVKSLNRNIQMKVNKDEKLDMTNHSIINLKFPLNSGDAVNKLYAHIYSKPDETNAENLCKVGEKISLILLKYPEIQFNPKHLSTSLAFAISMYNKYKDLSGSLLGNWNMDDISNSTVFVDLKVNIIKVIEVLPMNVFQELKKELNEQIPERGTRRRLRRFLIKISEDISHTEELDLLLNKNLLLIDIGFTYFMDSLLRILLV